MSSPRSYHDQHRHHHHHHYHHHDHEGDSDSYERAETNLDWIENPEEVQDGFEIEISLSSRAKNIRIISKYSVENFEDNINEFFDTKEYLFYPQGFQSCPHPIMVRKDTDNVAAIMPYRGTAEYDLYELSIPGYDIKYSEEDVETSSLLTFLKINLIPIYTMNSFLHFLEFLSIKSGYPSHFWSSVADDKNFILTRPKLLTIVTDEREEIMNYLKTKSDSYKIDTSSVLLEHLRYNEFRIDSIKALLILIRYSYKRGLEIIKLMQPDNLNEYLAKEKLLPLSRIMGYRMALDKLLYIYNIHLNEVLKEIETDISVSMNKKDEKDGGGFPEVIKTSNNDRSDNNSEPDYSDFSNSQ